MDSISIIELKKAIGSSNLNFLIGSGASRPFLPCLNDVEQKMNDAVSVDEQAAARRQYFDGVMEPHLAIFNNFVSNPDYDETMDAYSVFFSQLATVLHRRRNTTSNKQANVFTTNIDLLMEMALEKGRIEYNDGFSGRLHPVFALSNFNKNVFKKSLHFDNAAEIPTINLVKIHGSLNWQWDVDNKEFTYSNFEVLNKLKSLEDSQEFIDEYSNLSIVNPRAEKLEQTVIDTQYYEMLRLYSASLEKENTTLFIIGFSMADEHIKEITLRCAKENPTLRIYYFVHSLTDAADPSKNPVDEMKKMLKVEENRNIFVVKPKTENEDDKLNLSKINDEIFAPILGDNITQNGETSA